MTAQKVRPKLSKEARSVFSRVSRAQRSVERSGTVRCRTGTQAFAQSMGPGPAMHRYAQERFALHRIRDTRSEVG